MRRRRNRTLLLLILAILALMVGALIVLPRFTAGPLPTATPTPPFLKAIVIAAQNIPRGAVITESDVTLRGWPVEVLPEGAFEDPKAVIGKVARTDIPRQKPIVPEDLTEQPAEVARRGSAAALFVPKGKVAFAFPVDEAAAVAFNLAPGDRVDILVTFSFVIYQQLKSPKILDEDLARRAIALGMPAPEAVNLATSELKPEPQMVDRISQIVLQNVEVLTVGAFEPPVTMRPTPAATPAPGPTPTPTPRPRQQYIVLLVDPQDALVLQWLRESGAVVDFALRNPTDNQLVRTDPVTLEALMARLGITLPPAGNFALQADTTLDCPDPWAREPCR